MHELGNALDEGKGKDKGRTKAMQVRPDHALALAHALARLSSALLSSCIINETVWQGSIVSFPACFRLTSFFRRRGRVGPRLKGVLHLTRVSSLVEEVNDPLPLVEAIQCGPVAHSPLLKHAAKSV